MELRLWQSSTAEPITLGSHSTSSLACPSACSSAQGRAHHLLPSESMSSAQAALERGTALSRALTMKVSIGSSRTELLLPLGV